MIFELRKASEMGEFSLVEINTIDDLIKLQNELKREMLKDPWTRERFSGELVIDLSNKKIIFYDYWME